MKYSKQEEKIIEQYDDLDVCSDCGEQLITYTDFSLDEVYYECTGCGL